MNKTININLGGFFFHIDEVAYDKLKRYLESISKSLSDDPQGKNEIIADIEARISELLSEKITDTRQVVNEADIDNIISIMGQPEDYAETEEMYNTSSQSYQRNNTSLKKLFRDGDDKFLGGVASGIGHYFNVDTIWIRLLFILFAFSGTTILIYIILWILLPEAKTTAEKLQMEGEPVNIDNIEKKIRKEFNKVSENVRSVANQASEKFKDGAYELTDKMNKTFYGKTKKNNGLQDFINTLVNIILVLFKVIGKFIGAILVFVAAAVILSLIIGGFSVGSLEWLNVDQEFLHYPPFFYDAFLPKWLLTLAIFLLVGIPFLLLFILGLRILSSSVQKLSKATSLTLLGIWIIALLAIIFTGLEFGTSHAKYGQSVQQSDLGLKETDTITVTMFNDNTLFFKHNLKRNSDKKEIIVNGVSKAYSNDVRLNVKKSTTTKAYLIVEKESKGKNSKNAKINAEKIEYKFKISNKTIILDAYFLSDFKNFWKNEDVKITLYLPKNTTVYFDDSVKYFLNNVENTADIYDTEMVNHYFLMTDTTLHCTDCITEEVTPENENNTI